MKMGWMKTCAPMLLSVLLLAGCSGGTRSEAVILACDQFEMTPHPRLSVTLDEGESMTLTACSNPTTGFSWQAPTITDSKVVQVSDQTFIPGSESGAGVPGAQRWTLKALATGTTKVAFSYSRPWDGGEKDLWTIELEVKVN